MKRVEAVRLALAVCRESRSRIDDKDALLRQDRSCWTYRLPKVMFVVVKRHRRSLEGLMRTIVQCNAWRFMRFSRDSFRAASRAWQDSKWVSEIDEAAAGKDGPRLDWIQGYDLFCLVMYGDGLMEETRRWLNSEDVGENVWY